MDKRRKVDESSNTKDLKENSPEPIERRVRLISDSDEDENQWNMDCLSQSDNEVDPESGFGLTLSVPKLDYIVTVWSQGVHQ